MNDGTNNKSHAARARYLVSGNTSVVVELMMNRSTSNCNNRGIVQSQQVTEQSNDESTGLEIADLFKHMLGSRHGIQCMRPVGCFRAGKLLCKHAYRNKPRCHGGLRLSNESYHHLSFGPMAQCVVRALKGLAYRARVTPAISPASHCKQCSALTSPSLHARVAAPVLFRAC